MAWKYKRKSSFKKNLSAVRMCISAFSYMLDKIGTSKLVAGQIDSSNAGVGKSNGNFTDFKLYLERKHVFNRVINDQWLDLATDVGEDSLFLLRNFIHQKKEGLTHNVNSIKSNKLSDIPDSDFENLIFRLFEAMGFSVHKTGKIDDQGCELVINLDGQKIYLQAKHKEDSPIGNACIREALASQKLYDCTDMMIISTSNFTDEAIELANNNKVGLVSKERLSMLLSKYLKENWS